MDHLAEAKEYANCANWVDGEMFAQLNAQLATAHALIAIAERLPPPAEPWSASGKRPRQEDRDEL